MFVHGGEISVDISVSVLDFGDMTNRLCVGSAGINRAKRSLFVIFLRNKNDIGVAAKRVVTMGNENRAVRRRALSHKHNRASLGVNIHERQSS